MTLAVRCSSSHLCTPTARTEGCSAVPFAAGVPEDVGFSSALISANGENRTNPPKPIKKSKHRFGRCCFIGTLRSYLFSGLTLKAAKNEEKVPSLSTG